MGTNQKLVERKASDRALTVLGIAAVLVFLIADRELVLQRTFNASWLEYALATAAFFALYVFLMYVQHANEGPVQIGDEHKRSVGHLAKKAIVVYGIVAGFLVVIWFSPGGSAKQFYTAFQSISTGMPAATARTRLARFIEWDRYVEAEGSAARRRGDVILKIPGRAVYKGTPLEAYDDVFILVVRDGKVAEKRVSMD